MPIPTERDYAEIADALREGDVVPFLGAGASIGCGLPSGGKLAERLVAESEFPDQEGRGDLALVSSYLVQVRDSLKLKRILREVFTVDLAPGNLHSCLAAVEKLGLIVTTNYDDLIERSLAKRDPWIVVDRGCAGNVWATSPEPSGRLTAWLPTRRVNK